ncbi:uncharacterized protein MYCGRDRAFT_106583 [Zymoseptoria tritici IPO323]|uniref:Uncharacterized protein n=1 Tax=Zymoseptoria tritici (strain CBS 115943 / IPO323) TaxID=336722 RepID=F9XQK6_ZYMTI|nr:uncharacterized protein MYCGRDRAFT_106583 [Zymoseptoria tritici IPO323]EGP82475.1 hypothetical protein MYCGRDRAFT_106583 [Zymoseptoria tritici IPO323]
MSPRKAKSREAKLLKDDLKKQPAPRLPPTSKDRPSSRGRRMSASPQPSMQEDAPSIVDIPVSRPRCLISHQRHQLPLSSSHPLLPSLPPKAIHDLRYTSSLRIPMAVLVPLAERDHPSTTPSPAL